MSPTIGKKKLQPKKKLQLQWPVKKPVPLREVAVKRVQSVAKTSLNELQDKETIKLYGKTCTTWQ
jgi:hypothetical protein